MILGAHRATAPGSIPTSHRWKCVAQAILASIIMTPCILMTLGRPGSRTRPTAASAKSHISGDLPRLPCYYPYMNFSPVAVQAA